MSWFSWDNANISKIASSTLKNVQNKIDKVLDIQEGENAQNQSSGQSNLIEDKSNDSIVSSSVLPNSDDFFSTWMVNPQTSNSPSESILKLKKNSLSSEKIANLKEPKSDVQSVDLHASTSVSTASLSKIKKLPKTDIAFESIEGDWVNNESMTMSALEGHFSSPWFLSSQAGDDLSKTSAKEALNTLKIDQNLSKATSQSKEALSQTPESPQIDPSVNYKEEPSPESLSQDKECESEIPLVSSLSPTLETFDNEEEQPTPCPPQLPQDNGAADLDVLHNLSAGPSSTADSLRDSESSFPGVESSRASNVSDSTIVREMTGSESEKESTSLTLSASSAGEMQASSSDSQVHGTLPEDAGADSTDLHPHDSHTLQPDNIQESGMSSSFISAVSSTDSYIKFDTEDKEPLIVDVVNLEKESDSSPKTSDSTDEKRRKDSDELDTTTTSSDIEVISCCTSNNGENPQLTPNTAYGTRIASDVQHKRSASGTLYVVPDETVCKNLMIERLNREDIFKLLCDPHSEQADIKKKYLETAEVLEARETHMVQLSRENIELKEANNVLRQQLEQAELLHENEVTDLNTLTKEFTNRLSDAEKRFQTASRERDNLKKKLQQTESDYSKSEDKRSEHLLKEKEEQIAELLREGEKMAQDQLKSNNIIKKVRTREKELELTVKQMNETNDKLKSEIEHLKKVLDNKVENEKKHTDGIKQLTKAVQTQEKEISTLKGELEESLEKCRGLQNALDSCTKELSEAQKFRWESEATCTSIKKELAALQESRDTVSANQQTWRDQKEHLTNELEELRVTLSRQERDAARREDQMRAEISYIQSRFAAAEERNEELSQMVTTATKPVLKQLETLQSNYAVQNSNWEHAEQALNERLVETKKRLASALEQEQILKDQYNELDNSLVTAEAQASALRQEKSKLAAQLQTTQSKNQLLEEEKEKLQVQFECQKSGLERQLNDAKKEILYLENSLELEKHKLDVEKQRSTSLTSQIIAAQKQQKSRRSRSPSESSQLSCDSSAGSGPPTPTGSHSGSSWMGESTKRSSDSVYNVIRGHGNAYALDHLQETLKRKDGEINQLHSELRQLERTRTSLMTELSKQSTRCDELTETLRALEEKMSKMGELESKHSALLLMYGEKMEENEELKLDLRDVKEMYKSQINMLLRES